jgi:hypothetical protein
VSRPPATPFPSRDVAPLQVGDSVQVDIVLQRDIDGTDVTPVVTSYYPVPKEEVRCSGVFTARALPG